MTHIHRSQELLEQEEDGVTDLILVAVRYTGDKSTKSPQNLKSKAAWPGHSTFQGGEPTSYVDKNREIHEKTVDYRDVRGVHSREPGSWQVGLVPDVVDGEESPETSRNVGAIESMSDFEVSYNPEDLAQAMLEANYLPPEVFHNGFDPDIRERIFDRLEIEDRGVIHGSSQADEEPYRSQLRELAGEDNEPEPEEIRKTEIDELKNKYSRGELMSAASELGMDNANTGKGELATYIVEQEDYDGELE